MDAVPPKDEMNAMKGFFFFFLVHSNFPTIFLVMASTPYRANEDN